MKEPETKKNEIKVHIRFIDYASLIRYVVPKDAKVVDIGCDNGHMFRNYQHVTNVDKRSLKQIRDDAHDQTIDLPNFVQADAANLPFDALEFDWAVLCEILEHVEDPVKLLNEAQKVASQVILSVPNEHQWSSDKKPFGVDSSSSHHVRFYNEKTLFRDLELSGLQVLEFVKIIYSGWSYFILWGVSKSLHL